MIFFRKNTQKEEPVEAQRWEVKPGQKIKMVRFLESKKITDRVSPVKVYDGKLSVDLKTSDGKSYRTDIFPGDWAVIEDGGVYCFSDFAFRSKFEPSDKETGNVNNKTYTVQNATFNGEIYTDKCIDFTEDNWEWRYKDKIVYEHDGPIAWLKDFGLGLNATFNAILDEMKELHAKKNKDYGDSFHALYKEYGMPYALGHIEEKLNRVKALTKNGSAAVENEHLEDSLVDLASYSIMLLAELRSGRNVDTH